MMLHVPLLRTCRAGSYIIYVLEKYKAADIAAVSRTRRRLDSSMSA